MAQREKRHRISLSVTEEESEKIDEMAMKTGYATAKQSGAARYVKRLALGYTPKSVFDKKVIVEIGGYTLTFAGWEDSLKKQLKMRQLIEICILI